MAEKILISHGESIVFGGVIELRRRAMTLAENGVEITRRITHARIVMMRPTSKIKRLSTLGLIRSPRPNQGYFSELDRGEEISRALEKGGGRNSWNFKTLE